MFNVNLFIYYILKTYYIITVIDLIKKKKNNKEVKL